jgi:hypothetical protein
MELEGRKYELAPSSDCKGCAFRGCLNFPCLFDDACNFDDGDEPEWNGYTLCSELNGIWKEVKDDTTTN